MEQKTVKEKIMKQKTVLITGGSRGIGAACARAFAQRGCRVIIGYNNSKEAAEAVAEELNGHGVGDSARAKNATGPANETGLVAVALQADVTKAGQVRAMFCEARRLFGKIDILINNAGISQFALFTDISEEQWDLMMDTNCKGMFLCAQEALADMISEKQGAIVNISSIWGQVGASCEVHYSASKAAVIGLTKALAKEVGPSNIRVNCVAPGVIQTDMLAEVPDAVKKELAEETPLLRLGKPEEIAEVVCFLASEEAGFMTGQVVGANGGFVV